MLECKQSQIQQFFQIQGQIHSTLIVSNFPGMEKNPRQPEFKLKVRLWKPEVITGSQGMVKMNVKREGAKLKPSRMAENKHITDMQHVYSVYFFS